jgi:hypothetical protein
VSLIHSTSVSFPSRAKEWRCLTELIMISFSRGSGQSL